jgi:aminopeptidase N
MIGCRIGCRRLRSAAWRASLGAAVLVAALAAGQGVASAESVYSFASTPGRLPKAVIPVHYAIDLVPDLESLTIAGAEVVDIEVLEPTDRLVLNAVNMTLDAAALDGESGLAAISLDAAAETAALTFPRPLAAGPHKLRIAFTAHINKFGRGLYSVDYPTPEGRKRMIASQLEPADARRIFPCWDEPVFKASFALDVTVPQALTAVSNMPVTREAPAGDGRKRVSFAPTPRMSSYLFVLVAGELETLSGEADGVAVNVVTTRGKREHGRFALESAIALLKYFNDYFGVAYPLPKLDLIAVPGGFGGAMENWGGIVFFESRLLFDPASSAPGAQRGIVAILAHEMAHQWFGDLVTMAWWDNLWLNEGFASWMQVKAAERLRPDWQVWLSGNGAKQGAMDDDARSTTHPIQQPVANESEAMAAFDAITYNKGQAFIRMLESYLGEDVFRDGIRRYMRDHAFGSATTADLWQALEAASGKPVAGIASAFTEQPGVPLVAAEVRCADGRQRVVLKNERFTIHDPTPRPQRWPVPVAFGAPGAPPPGSTVLTENAMAEIDAGACGEPVKLNLGDVGYYRVEYDAVSRAALVRSLGAMAAADRVNLLADTWALVEAGRVAPAGYLDLMDAIAGDDDRAVCEQAIRTFTRIDQLERGRPARPAFQAFARARLRPVLARLSWDGDGDAGSDRALLRARLIQVLGELDDTEVLAEANRRFVAFVANPDSLRPELREAVTRLAGRSGDRAVHETLLALARKTTNTEERVRYYTAAAAALDPALAQDTLALTLTDELPTTMVGGVIFAAAAEHRDLALAFVQANFAALAAKQGPSFRDYFVSNLMASFADPARAEELANFAPVHRTSGGRIVAARAIELIRTNADFRARQLVAVDEWVRRAARP